MNVFYDTLVISLVILVGVLSWIGKCVKKDEIDYNDEYTKQCLEEGKGRGDVAISKIKEN